MISNKIFTTKEKSLAEIGRNFATKTAIPVIPPNVKLFANLKEVNSDSHNECADCK